MGTAMKIDFVSDISCPWCVIGLQGLERALANIGGAIAADFHFQPYELNPDMTTEGENLAGRIERKYGMTADQAANTRETIRQRAAAVGFTIVQNADSRIYNTFDAHRLLHWAGPTGQQRALKHALFHAYFTEGRNPGDHDVLVDAALGVGLDGDAAREVLTSGRFADEVRAAERFWQGNGINSVPAIIINGKYLISGGQTPEVFEQALREIAAA